MTRRSAPRRSRRKTILGVPTCRTCGRIYSRRAMVCPICHNNPSLGLARTTSQARPVAVIVDFSAPTLSVQITYPDWLKQFDAVTGQSLVNLSNLVKNNEVPMSVRDTALALLSLRYRQALSPQIDLAAVETEVKLWLTQHS